jgi:hypothetical protein
VCLWSTSALISAGPEPSRLVQGLTLDVWVHAVWWFAPFFSGGGYASEAVAFALALARVPHGMEEGRLWITQHGDSYEMSALQV